MNPRTTDTAVDALDQLPCPCHGVTDCPELTTIAIPAAQLADIAELLGVVDEFLRCRNGTADRLADFYARHGEPHPAFVANNLIDQVSFTAAALRRHGDGGLR